MEVGQVLSLLQLCDSLFPLGAFAHSDGLEAATTSGAVATSKDLAAWMDAILDRAFRESDGPALSLAWAASLDGRWDDLRALDDELYALRPASTSRAASRAMGGRLLKTWHEIRPSGVRPRSDPALTLPVAFAVVCALEHIPLSAALGGYVYTRLAATASAAMRLMPIGQHEAHRLLAERLLRVPDVVQSVINRPRPPQLFAPALDIAAMSQQYVSSRLFRS
jgi:urease accessory protein